MPVRRRVDIGVDGLGQELAGGAAVGPDGIVTGVERARVGQRPGPDLVVVFHTQKDDRVRPEHAALDGMVWELDDAAVPQPPLGYGCRCFVVIEPRPSNAPDDRAEAFDRHPERDEVLGRSLGPGAVDAYRVGALRAGDLFLRQGGGQMINRTQARAIIASRRRGEDPKRALSALAALSARGLHGQRLESIVAKAAARVQGGMSPRQAAAVALMDSPRRGMVTRSTADAAAREMLRTGLLADVRPAPVPSLAGMTSSIAARDAGGTRDAIRSFLARMRLPARASLPRRSELGVEPAGDLRGWYEPKTGRMAFNRTVWREAQDAGAALAAGKMPTAQQLTAVRTMIHEGLHEAGPLRSTRTYYGAGKLVEEVTTEVLARRVIRARTRTTSSLFQLPIAAPSPSRSYDPMIYHTIQRTAAASGLSTTDAARALERASYRFKRRSGAGLSTAGHVATALAEDLATTIRRPDLAVALRDGIIQAAADGGV
jgi:hypothetical protein